MLKKSIIKYLLAILHGIFLLVLTWIWLSSYLTYGDEFWLVKWSSTIKRVFLKLEEPPQPNKFLFIDLAYDKAVIPREDGPGTEVITDRAKLAHFFDISSKRPDAARFVFCDVFLLGNSDWDDSLVTAVNKNKNIVFPIHKNSAGALIVPALDIPYAIADYQSNRGNTFMKFKLFQDSLYHTVPMFMYESLNNPQFSKGPVFSFDSGLPILNSVIIDYPIRTYQLMDVKEYTLVSLSELLILPEEIIINEYLKDRIVVMGDFKNDIHNTIFGPMAGTLIIVNTYLTLENGHHRLPLSWFTFLLLCYSLLSFHILFAPKRYHVQGITDKIVARYPFFRSFLKYLFILSFVSVLSYLVFGIHINILIIAIYINTLGFIRKLWANPQWKKEIKDWVVNLKNEYFKFY